MGRGERKSPGHRSSGVRGSRVGSRCRATRGAHPTSLATTVVVVVGSLRTNDHHRCACNVRRTMQRRRQRRESSINCSRGLVIKVVHRWREIVFFFPYRFCAHTHTRARWTLARVTSATHQVPKRRVHCVARRRTAIRRARMLTGAADTVTSVAFWAASPP